VGDPEATSQVGVAALPLGGDDLSNRLDVIFRLFAGMVSADPIVGCMRGVRSAWFTRQFGNSQKADRPVIDAAVAIATILKCSQCYNSSVSLATQWPENSTPLSAVSRIGVDSSIESFR